MNFAIIENGTVVNVIVGPLPDGVEGVLANDSVSIGDNYSDGTFTKPKPTESLTIDEQIAALQAQIDALEALRDV